MAKPSTSILRVIALKIEFLYRKFHRLIAWLTGYLRLPITCDVYYAIEHEHGMAIKGRVMRVRKIHEPDPDDSRIRNFLEMFKNWVTPERPYTEVLISWGKHQLSVKSDRGGYFEAEFESPHQQGPVIFEIPVRGATPVSIDPVTYSPADAEYLLISDIDDTVLITNAATTLRMIATTLLGNALTRQIFPGTAALYQGLKQGTTVEDHPHINPICYVTSSPFNLHNLVSLIFQTNEIPGGAFLMAAWGMDETKWFRHGHRDHKFEAIKKALSWYPSLPVILIGDSGEHDTDIYAEVAVKFPDRIIDVMIRNVCSKSKIAVLRSRWNELVGEDNFFIFSDCMEAAAHLRQRGRISLSAVEAVAKSIEEADESILTTLIEPMQKHLKTEDKN
ncbi:MAG: DUF2183 domain-containing protein [Verrucomicrobiales bacterium]|nr:DUF2183 domain-containing protein [Verrucomicrobiales bacterium]